VSVTDDQRPKRHRIVKHFSWANIAVYAMFLMVIYLLVRDTGERERAQESVDALRRPMCSLLVSVLARPPADSRPTTLEARRSYALALGSGSDTIPGLHCDDVVPGARELLDRVQTVPAG
jgi:hypothetical protein